MDLTGYSFTMTGDGKIGIQVSACRQPRYPQFECPQSLI
jgi:hypothetical protein